MPAAALINKVEPAPSEVFDFPESEDREGYSLVTEQWIGRMPDRPITADEFYREFEGKHDRVELIDGKVIRKPMVQFDHAQAELWLAGVFDTFVRETGAGNVSASRRAVQLSNFKVRLPDIVFVRTEHLAISEQKAVLGTPDLVIEIVSPGDRKANLVASEADYRTLGVPEIVYLDLPRQRVRVLRRPSGADADAYTEEVLHDGDRWVSTGMPGMVLDAAWMLHEPRPSALTTVLGLLGRV